VSSYKFNMKFIFQYLKAMWSPCPVDAFSYADDILNEHYHFHFHYFHIHWDFCKKFRPQRHCWMMMMIYCYLEKNTFEMNLLILCANFLIMLKNVQENLPWKSQSHLTSSFLFELLKTSLMWMCWASTNNDNNIFPW